MKFTKDIKAPLIAQLVKNPPAMWETWVQSLDWEDPLEKGKSTHSSILAWRIPWTVQGCKESDMTERISFSLSRMWRAISIWTPSWLTVGLCSPVLCHPSSRFDMQIVYNNQHRHHFNCLTISYTVCPSILLIWHTFFSHIQNLSLYLLERWPIFLCCSVIWK